MKKKIMFLILCLFIGIHAYSQGGNISKQYDYLVLKIKQPTYGAAMFKYNEITPQNTQFLSKSEYRSKPFVVKRFTVNGSFDEAEWNRFYDLLSEEWYRFCYWDYQSCANIEVHNSNSDRFKPTNVKIVYCKGCTFWKIIK